MGSINLLELTRLKSWKSPIIVVTTDKVYENVDYTKAYVETDGLGGLDPYSSSKAALELAVKAWRNSFTGPRQRDKRLPLIGTVRSGNVIGGGDYAPNRIIPDLIRAGLKSEELIIRNPNSTRPWIHVLDPLRGYRVTR